MRHGVLILTIVLTALVASTFGHAMRPVIARADQRQVAIDYCTSINGRRLDHKGKSFCLPHIHELFPQTQD